MQELIRVEGKTFSVSRITKSVHKLVDPIVPKSKKMKVRRNLVKLDKAGNELAYQSATNPGKVSSKMIEKVAESPVTMMPGGLSVGGTVSTAIRKKPSTIDDLLRDTKVGKPIYSAVRETGRVVGRITEPLVNSAYQMAKSM